MAEPKRPVLAGCCVCAVLPNNPPLCCGWVEVVAAPKSPPGFDAAGAADPNKPPPVAGCAAPNNPPDAGCAVVVVEPKRPPLVAAGFAAPNKPPGCDMVEYPNNDPEAAGACCWLLGVEDPLAHESTCCPGKVARLVLTYKRFAEPMFMLRAGGPLADLASAIIYCGWASRLELRCQARNVETRRAQKCGSSFLATPATSASHNVNSQCSKKNKHNPISTLLQDGY